MCCFYWLMNKELFEPMGGKNRTRRGKLGCLLRERKAETERCHGASRVRYWELTQLATAT